MTPEEFIKISKQRDKFFKESDEMSHAIGRVAPALDLLQYLLCMPEVELGKDDLSGLSFLLQMCCETLEEAAKPDTQPET